MKMPCRRVHIRGTPIRWLENSVNIWNLLWLPGRLIISTRKTSIYILSTFPNALTSKKAQNREISIQLFRQRLSYESVKAYATMPIGIMGSKSLALLD